MSLTPEQRAEYADMLAEGVPEEVIEEFDARLSAYVTTWKQGVAAHVQKVNSRKQ
jgi:predicted phosphoadenosine phosphosulfate sulfurtransferase